MHFQKLQSSARWEDPVRFLWNFNNKQEAHCCWNRGHVENKTAPWRHPTYHALWSEEQGCTFCSIMRPRRSCFWAARRKTVRFQFKIIWLFIGNSNGRINSLLLLGFCCCYLWLCYPKCSCLLITLAPPSLWWMHLELWVKQHKHPQQHNKQLVTEVGGSGSEL